MTSEQISICIQSAMVFFALAALWHFGLRQLAIDAFRQDLFEARDRLFDLAFEGDGSGFGFDHPVYGTLRRQFHSSIRLAHRLSMIQVCTFFVFRLIFGPRVQFDEMIPPVESQLGGVDDHTQARILEIKHEWDKATLRFLMRTSLLFYVAFALLFVWLVIFRCADYLANKVAMRRRVAERISCTVWQDVAMTDYIEQFEAAELQGRSERPIVTA